MMTSSHIHPALQAGQNHTPNHGSGVSGSCASIGLFLGLVPREMEAVFATTHACSGQVDERKRPTVNAMAIQEPSDVFRYSAKACERRELRCGKIGNVGFMNCSLASPRVSGRVAADPCQQESSGLDAVSHEREHKTTLVDTRFSGQQKEYQEAIYRKRPG